VSRPSRSTVAGRAYLALQRRARSDHRPTDELLQLHALEGFLDRVSRSRHAQHLVLKGGLLLAAFGDRRPTRDIDLQAEAISGEIETVRSIVLEIAAIPDDDGLEFDGGNSVAHPIRDTEPYAGVRVTMRATLATARVYFHVDVSVGDPISPAPRLVRLPRLIGAPIVIRGYPLAMVHAEKIVTAIARGASNTRWRDFADVYTLSRRHAIEAAELLDSIRRVAVHRGIGLQPLAPLLAGLDVTGQRKWEAWRRRQGLDQRLPSELDKIIAEVVGFVDPVVRGSVPERKWDPEAAAWR
jgi:hypothetical protein